MPTIYVELLEEGTICYRPVEAIQIDNNSYQITSLIPDDEIWAFQTSDIVKCSIKKLSDGDTLVATSKI